MDRPSRQQQAQAILQLQGRPLASRILGRRAITTSDFEEAFNLERIDLIAEIPTPDIMLALGRNITGPQDGLYVLDDGESYRVYIQEHGVVTSGVVGVDFDEARNAIIDSLLLLGGLPFRPPG